MKLKLNELRSLINEEFMRGVPEFVIRQATDECADKIRQHLKKFIQLRAKNPVHARQMIQAANSTLDELDKKLYDVVEEKLWLFLQQV